MSKPFVRSVLSKEPVSSLSSRQKPITWPASSTLSRVSVKKPTELEKRESRSSRTCQVKTSYTTLLFYLKDIIVPKRKAFRAYNITVLDSCFELCFITITKYIGKLYRRHIIICRGLRVCPRFGLCRNKLLQLWRTSWVAKTSSSASHVGVRTEFLPLSCPLFQ